MILSLEEAADKISLLEASMQRTVIREIELKRRNPEYEPKQELRNYIKIFLTLETLKKKLIREKNIRLSYLSWS